MDQTLVFDLNQAAINGIREAGATAQLILVEGNDYTKASTWVTQNGNLVNLQDPNKNLAYEMHQYLNAAQDGLTEECVSATIGVDRLREASEWCLVNDKMCFLGEVGGGHDQDCLDALNGMLEYMLGTGVWIGALWWWAGPWWEGATDTKYLAIEPQYGATPAAPNHKIYMDGVLRRHRRPLFSLKLQPQQEAAEIPLVNEQTDL